MSDLAKRKAATRAKWQKVRSLVSLLDEVNEDIPTRRTSTAIRRISRSVTPGRQRANTLDLGSLHGITNYDRRESRQYLASFLHEGCVNEGESSTISLADLRARGSVAEIYAGFVEEEGLLERNEVYYNESRGDLSTVSLVV